MNGKNSYVSKQGDEYEAVSEVYADLMWVYNGGKYGFVNKDGKVIIPLQYDGASDFSEGVAAVKKNGKYGYIDKNGKAVIAFQYDYAGGFQNGQAQVGARDGKTPYYFYIDKAGKVLTKRSSLAEFRKKLRQGDVVDKGMILEFKGDLVQVQTTEEQCTQRDYRGYCQNSITNSVNKWVKRSEIYPVDY
ncbi:MAG: WG repeat-containing protein [Moraxella sp.]|nr:WG repeat-containing protein [Moraxella sp.]